jgi:hypothetical protein
MLKLRKLPIPKRPKVVGRTLNKLPAVLDVASVLKSLEFKTIPMEIHRRIFAPTHHRDAILVQDSIIRREYHAWRRPDRKELSVGVGKIPSVQNETIPDTSRLDKLQILAQRQTESFDLVPLKHQVETIVLPTEGLGESRFADATLAEQNEFIRKIHAVTH